MKNQVYLLSYLANEIRERLHQWQIELSGGSISRTVELHKSVALSFDESKNIMYISVNRFPTPNHYTNIKGEEVVWHHTGVFTQDDKYFLKDKSTFEQKIKEIFRQITLGIQQGISEYVNIQNLIFLADKCPEFYKKIKICTKFELIYSTFHLHSEQEIARFLIADKILRDIMSMPTMEGTNFENSFWGVMKVLDSERNSFGLIQFPHTSKGEDQQKLNIQKRVKIWDELETPRKTDIFNRIFEIIDDRRDKSKDRYFFKTFIQGFKEKLTQSSEDCKAIIGTCFYPCKNCHNNLSKTSITTVDNFPIEHEHKKFQTNTFDMFYSTRLDINSNKKDKKESKRVRENQKLYVNKEKNGIISYTVLEGSRVVNTGEIKKNDQDLDGFIIPESAIDIQDESFKESILGLMAKRIGYPLHHDVELKDNSLEEECGHAQLLPKDIRELSRMSNSSVKKVNFTPLDIEKFENNSNSSASSSSTTEGQKLQQKPKGTAWAWGKTQYNSSPASPKAPGNESSSSTEDSHQDQTLEKRLEGTAWGKTQYNSSLASPKAPGNESSSSTKSTEDKQLQQRLKDTAWGSGGTAARVRAFR